MIQGRYHPVDSATKPRDLIATRNLTRQVQKLRSVRRKIKEVGCCGIGGHSFFGDLSVLLGYPLTVFQSGRDSLHQLRVK